MTPWIVLEKVESNRGADKLFFRASDGSEFTPCHLGASLSENRQSDADFAEEIWDALWNTLKKRENRNAAI